jgi:hypothetical protein
MPVHRQALFRTYVVGHQSNLKKAMGLFSTVLHIYQKGQTDVVTALTEELKQNHSFAQFFKLSIPEPRFEQFLQDEVRMQKGIYYLITQPHGNWTSVIELDVNLDESICLYEIANSMSKRLDTYVLSFHLHDDDVLYYNLERKGESIDGYNSDYQYFEAEPVAKEDIVAQRHAPESFSELLPSTKDVDGLNQILNEGMWAAFDNNDLDDDGVPKDDDKYYVDELDRFERVGQYLEIYSADQYPFANWFAHLEVLNLNNCYILRVDK